MIVERLLDIVYRLLPQTPLVLPELDLSDLESLNEFIGLIFCVIPYHVFGLVLGVIVALQSWRIIATIAKNVIEFIPFF